MTDQTKVLELAKKCGAKVVYEGAQHTIFFESQLDLSAYNSAIEEKYQARIQKLEMQSRGNWIDAEQQAQKVTELQAQIVALEKQVNPELIDHYEAMQKQIAMLRQAVVECIVPLRGLDTRLHSELAKQEVSNAIIKADAAIFATQATADAFIADIEAGAMEEAAKKCGMIADANPYRYGKGADKCEEVLMEIAAEKRKQAEQGKEG